MLNERPIGENLAELAKIAEEHLTDEDRLCAGTWVGMLKQECQKDPLLDQRSMVAGAYYGFRLMSYAVSAHLGQHTTLIMGGPAAKGIGLAALHIRDYGHLLPCSEEETDILYKQWLAMNGMEDK